MEFISVKLTYEYFLFLASETSASGFMRPGIILLIRTAVVVIKLLYCFYLMRLLPSREERRSKLAQAGTPMTCIRQVSVSNFGLSTNYPD
jgi:hypothetical protein